MRTLRRSRRCALRGRRHPAGAFMSSNFAIISSSSFRLFQAVCWKPSLAYSAPMGWIPRTLIATLPHSMLAEDAGQHAPTTAEGSLLAKVWALPEAQRPAAPPPPPV